TYYLEFSRLFHCSVINVLCFSPFQAALSVYHGHPCLSTVFIGFYTTWILKNPTEKEGFEPSRRY
ncbi:MAG: hypothetical protein Q4F05_16240, partial [bacterium]|nr:hypothetical protein [bacterium]